MTDYRELLTRARNALQAITDPRAWKLIEEIDAALTEPDDGWMPIETVPKDGRDVLIGAWYNNGVWSAELAQWRHYANGWRWSYPVGQSGQPTHWQPLPNPPVRP